MKNNDQIFKTYTESKGEAPFNWNEALSNPPERDSPQHIHLCNLAARWTTCACGNLCDIIPRNEIGTPMDNLLEALGVDFSEDIEAACWDSAKEILLKIEQRSTTLINELIKNQKL